MAGIYIHIPYCKSKCAYCDFYSSTFVGNKNEWISSMIDELTERRGELKNEVVSTVYFGGGTPSLLSVEEINLFLKAVQSNYNCDFKEVTLEANPDDLTLTYIQDIKSTLINRLSIGIQSFNDDDLRLINRRHSSQQAIDAVRNCQKQGFSNISIDLIYGLPNQNLAKWEENLKIAVQLNVPHISAYHLTYEEGTKLYRMKEKGIIREIDEELSLQLFYKLKETLEQHGIMQYEISNFAKPGYESKHNSSYWNETPYLGIGPSAHSYNRETRRWNVANTRLYLQNRRNNETYFETEILDKNTRYNDLIITSLRTVRGLNLEILKKKFGEKMFDYCMENAAPFLKRGLLKTNGDCLALTLEGVFLSDNIMEELLWVD